MHDVIYVEKERKEKKKKNMETSIYENRMKEKKGNIYILTSMMIKICSFLLNREKTSLFYTTTR
jgi:hypothetical protein